MNILNRVTIQTLKRNKTRTIVTVIGMILSTALICAITTCFASFIKYGKDSSIYMNGNWHGSAFGGKNTLDIIADSSDVEEYCYNVRHRFAEYYGENDDPDNGKVHIVVPASDNYYDMMSARLSEGRYPENSNELLVAESKTRMYPEFSLGSEVKMGIGTYGSDIADGKLTDIDEVRTFRVVGILEESNADYAAMFTAADPADEADPEEEYLIWFRMKDPSDIYDFMSDNSFGNEVNDSLLIFYGVTMRGELLAVMFVVAAIVIGIVAFGAMELVSNAFNISISERTKQFGLLSSVGATKKQLRRMVFYEALVISAIGIPLGIFVGLAGIWVTFKGVGTSFANLVDVPFNITMEVSPAAIAAAVIMTAAIVIAAAWGPAQRATKVTAIEAIRQNSDIKNSKSLRKVPRLTAKLFGLPGVLAVKHFKCNKSRNRSTIISLLMSVVLFISASSFTMYLVESAEYEYDGSGCDVGFLISKDDMDGRTEDEYLSVVKETDGVTKAAYAYCIENTAKIDSSYLNKEAVEKFGADTDGKTSIKYIAVFINDDEFKKLLKSNGLSEKVFMNSAEPLAVAADRTKYWDNYEERYEQVDIFSGDEAICETEYVKVKEGYIGGGFVNDEGMVRYTDKSDFEKHIDIPASEAVSLLELKVGATVKNCPYYGTSENPLTLVYPYSLATTVLQTDTLESYLYFFTMSSDHRATRNGLDALFQSSGMRHYSIDDYAEEVEAVKSIVMIVKVFSYGFIVIISLISAANVFNTVTTNVNLRRKEFAMLRSVGMSARGLDRMMNLESLLYGIKALVFGLPISAAVTYLIYLAERGVFPIVFKMPWNAVLIAVFSVFAVVFAAMLYSMHKIKRDNPIDALKTETT